MGRLTVWLNQQIAQILGDLQEREPLKEPSPVRACCRIFFVVCLLLTFSLLLGYNIVDAPDARVVQVHSLTPGDKNQDFPRCFLYDRSSPKCKKWPTANFPPNIAVSCPCTNTSAPWKNFVKFYLLREDSTVWNMSFSWESLVTESPVITAPNDTIPLRRSSVVKDPKVLTAENFCDLSSMWPIKVNSTTSDTVEYVTQNVTENSTLRLHCIWMATLMFPGSNPYYEDRARSTRFLNTPSLLKREELNTHLAQLALESVLMRRLALDMALSLNLGTEDFRRFYNALAHLLATLLDRPEMDPNESYVYGARQLASTLSSNQFYDENAKVWYLGDNSGPIFLQPEIDWEAYHQMCYPEYCEVIKPLRGAQKFYWACGILGGVATIIVAIVTTLLWPCTAMLLLWVSKRNAVPPLDSKRPSEPLSHHIGL